MSATAVAPVPPRRRYGFPLAVALAVGLIAGVAWLNLVSGSHPVPAADVLRILLGGADGEAAARFTVLGLRLPRIIAALAVGAALAVSGVLLQAATGNRLVEPGLIGVNHGASLTVVTALVFIDAFPRWLIAPLACAGALASGVAVYRIAGGARATRQSIILVGLGFAALATAALNVAIAVGEFHRIAEVLTWLTGSFHGVDWATLGYYGWTIPLLIGIAYLQAPALNVFGLGRTAASGLGCRVESITALLIALAAALAGVAVALAGALGFVGLIAPHMARLVVGPQHGRLLPMAACLGALLTLCADTVGRLALPPLDIPAGIPLALLGVPFFLILFRTIR